MSSGNSWPQRRSPRLKDYDYAQNGAYIITVCTQNKVCLFGEIVEGDMRLNDAGKMVEAWWSRLPEKFPTIRLDAWAVMPNHLHGVVMILSDLPTVSLTEAVQWFKTMTTNMYIRGAKQHDWQPFPGKLWQTSFYDHVIRREESLDKIRRFVTTNPLRWAVDKENPARFR
jgi:REP element-mobilizing transposase RayT